MVGCALALALLSPSVFFLDGSSGYISSWMWSYALSMLGDAASWGFVVVRELAMSGEVHPRGPCMCSATSCSTTGSAGGTFTCYTIGQSNAAILNCYFWHSIFERTDPSRVSPFLFSLHAPANAALLLILLWRLACLPSQPWALERSALVSTLLVSMSIQPSSYGPFTSSSC